MCINWQKPGTRALTLKQKESLSRGFDSGNYGNAYESTDWHRWSATRLDNRTTEYKQGALLGFFSTYELDEIDDEECRDLVETLRARFCEEYDEASYGGM